MINKLIEKYKQLTVENYDDDYYFADLSKAIVYQEIIQDLKKVKEPTICGHTVEEIITILNGLELERKLDIKMTMGNLSILAEKLQEDFANSIEKTLKNVCRLGVDTDE